MTTGTTVAEVFADRDYGGASLALAVGDYDIEALQASLGNDTISSVKVAEGYRVTLYSDAGFSGSDLTLTSDTPYVGDLMNDRISSVLVEPIPTVSEGAEGGQQVVFIQPPSYH